MKGNFERWEVRRAMESQRPQWQLELVGVVLIVLCIIINLK